jgi:hypothetical protein
LPSRERAALLQSKAEQAPCFPCLPALETVQ